MTDPRPAAAAHARDLAELVRTRDETLPFFGAAPEALGRSYAPGKWDLRRFLLHLADCEGVFLDRVRRVLAEAKPLLMDFDEDRWAERLYSDKRSLAIASDLYRANREALIELARVMPPAAWAMVGVHSSVGRRSVAQLVAKAHLHNDHHLSQLRAIAAGEPWAPRRAVYATEAEPPEA